MFGVRDDVREQHRREDPVGPRGVASAGEELLDLVEIGVAVADVDQVVLAGQLHERRPRCVQPDTPCGLRQRSPRRYSTRVGAWTAVSTGRTSENTIISAVLVWTVGPGRRRGRRRHCATNSGSFMALGAVYISPCSSNRRWLPEPRRPARGSPSARPGVGCSSQSRIAAVEHERGVRVGQEAAKKIPSSPDPLFATTPPAPPRASSTASMSLACSSSESGSERPIGSERPDPLVEADQATEARQASEYPVVGRMSHARSRWLALPP